MGEISLQYLPAIRIAALRHQGAHDPQITDGTWQKLILWASPRRLLGRNPEIRGVGLLWDNPQKIHMRNRRYDVGVPIEPGDMVHVETPVMMLVTAPGRYLHASHKGSYENINSTYEDIFNGAFRYDGWVLTAQPIVEIYRNSPSEVSEDELYTDIYLPVIKMKD